ncbi:MULTISPECIES: hypothetical protein [unclassified Staphylococcus]|uniref:hypothetical protein n=1 Tax=unclassified Staphylococcus TaxID=91994 RepID=UPI00295E330F|nr:MULTISPECIES: hypothetical protein [unclassified Staphylococcus]
MQNSLLITNLKVSSLEKKLKANGIVNKSLLILLKLTIKQLLNEKNTLEKRGEKCNEIYQLVKERIFKKAVVCIGLMVICGFG